MEKPETIEEVTLDYLQHLSLSEQKNVSEIFQFLNNEYGVKSYPFPYPLLTPTQEWVLRQTSEGMKQYAIILEKHESEIKKWWDHQEQVKLMEVRLGEVMQGYIKHISGWDKLEDWSPILATKVWEKAVEYTHGRNCYLALYQTLADLVDLVTTVG